MAMGADAGSVLGMVLRQGMKQLIAGTVLGLAGAAAVGRALENLLVDTTAGDPAVHLAGSLMPCAIALIACLVPAWKASRMDPLAALRVR